MECVTGIASGVLSKIAELLIEPIGANCAYLISYDDNLTSLNDALEALEGKKQQVLSKMLEDQNSGREILPYVKDWLQKVEEIQADLRSFKEVEARRNKKCLGGWCPNLKTRYSFSKNAKKNADKLVQLKEQKLEKISAPAPPLKYEEFFSTKGIKSFESRNEIVRGVIEKLKEEGCNKISICGMGGVGKTTLVTEVIKIVEAEKLFDNIAMVTVSQTPNISKIQTEIAARLDLKLTDKNSETINAQEILAKINRSPGVLIVLDDVWMELDLVSIGIPSNGNPNTCKVIFTSRNEGECSKMGSQKTFTVISLSKEDSWALFEEIVGGDVMNKAEIRLIAEDIAKQCGGLPIALVTVGKALRGKGEKYVWENALKDLRTSSASFSDVEKCIELSYTLLDKRNAKDLLFLCCSFPEDTDIPIEVLLREGWGLGRLFQGEDYSLYEARNKTHSLVDDLKACFLLLNSDKKECVKMHDVVRDVITSIASKKEDYKIQCEDVEKWRPDKSTSSSCSAISIRTSEVQCPNVVDYPKLEILRAESPSRWSKISIPAKLFHGMSSLKVLYLFSSFIPDASSLFPTLKCLGTLRLEDCEVGDVSIIGKELLALEILSFARSGIVELPTEIGQLCSLRLLDLTECDKLCKISSNVLARLDRLEEFYFMTRSFRWMQNHDFVDELQTVFHRLKLVEIAIKKVESVFDYLSFKNVSRFLVQVGVAARVYDSSESAGYMKPNMLRLRDVNYSSIECSKLITQLIQKCEILRIDNVKNLKNIIFGSKGGVELSYLKDLKIQSCSDLECLTEEEEGEEHKSMSNMPSLVKLELRYLPKLTCFRRASDMNKSQFQHLETIVIKSCKSLAMAFDSQAFQNLRDLSISYCDSIKHIFSPANGEVMPQLEKLHIKGCKEMSNLVGCSKDKEAAEDYNCEGKVKIIVFKKLYRLSLSFLPKLESICTNSYEQVQCPSLMRLDIFDCPMLKAPSFQNHMPQESNSLDMVFDPQVFQSLRSLRISRCHSLAHIFTPVMSNVAPELEELEISLCEKMTSLVGESKNHREVNTIVFKKLYSLSLDDLPLCESICSNSCDTEWPSLRQLNIQRCLVLKSLPLFQIEKHLMQDNHEGVTSYSNTKKNKSSHSNCFLECAPVLSKFIHQANTNKKPDKTAITAKDQPSSITMIESMPILEKIHIKDCDDMQNILHLVGKNYDSTIHSQLKTIQIERCEKLASIVSKINGEEIKKIMEYFSELQSLELNYLPNLSSFVCSETCTSMDKLPEVMGACEGNQLQLVPFIDVDVFLFSNLRSLVIRGCNKIHILFSSSSLESLRCLEHLKLEYCDNIVEIVSANKIVFPKLEKLFLEGLPKLKSFSQGPNDMDFPSLQTVEIIYCPSMGMFSQGSSNTPKLKHFKMKIGLYTSEYVYNGDLNATIKGFKAFVELQHEEMLSWNDHHNEGLIYFINSEMDLERFHKLRMVVPFNDRRKLQNVRRLCIENCDSLVEVFQSREEIMDAKERDDEIIHYELRSMTLTSLPELRHIWGPKLMPLVTFDKLTSITVKYCRSLKSLMSHSMAKRLVHLENLRVKYCYIMEAIVTEEYDDENREKEVLEREKKKIKGVYLLRLPKLLSITSPNVLQRVMNLRITDCNSLQKVFESEEVFDVNQRNVTTQYEIESMELWNLPKLTHIWGASINRKLVSFDKLTSIQIDKCNSLKSLLSYSMAKNLVQLQRLVVLNCGMMEVIVTIEDESMDNRGNKVISLFPNLQKLELYNLPKLECICSQLDCGYGIPLCSEEEEEDNKQIHISLPQLNEVTLRYVPSLKCFCPGAYDYDIMLSSSSCFEDCTLFSSFPNGKVTVSTPNLQMCRLGYYNAEYVPILEDLNTTIHIWHNKQKYKVELQRLDTLACIEQDGYQHLLAYVLRSRKLILDSCHKLITCIPSDTKNRLLFQHLEELNVEHCECLQVIFESNDFGGTELTSMRLSSLPNPGPLSSFTNLKMLRISECHDMKFVFPNVSVAMNLSGLSELTVWECNQMEEIIQKENVDNSFISKVDKVIFPKLYEIKLEKLPELNCFCKSSFCYELSSCKRIYIKECPKMETFCSGTLCAPKLEDFRVEGMKCDVEENINEEIKGRHRGIN
ncbi:hypothetical protein PIB30_080271 [Stylosanthes scabra]|uniref:Uncharacterized protein n=1 Tax=Stylosanthes scabra TaxID=79078 RepID=A0ABU6SSA4_9FABA|nr:hypothetical protein [Stylosanthes scabra]